MPTIGKEIEEEISLYFHIPFCTKKCDYCHFYVLPDKEIYKVDLLKAFKLEWERSLPLLKNKKISTVYFGGGTPFLFGPHRISELLKLVSESLPFSSSHPEITLEANPENIQSHLMKEYAQAGISRVSIGIQTLDNDLLKLLGRTHDAKSAQEAVHTTYSAGIQNISIDLMYDIPNQKLTHWERTLDEIKDLPISHLSLYNLTFEPHTVFFKKQEILKKLIPDENASLAMYEMAVERLHGYGLKQYEISAFAKEGCHSRHNVGYWTARPFLGFGPSAFSYWDRKRFKNISNLKTYSDLLSKNQSPIDFEEYLEDLPHRRELFVIQLRLKAGVDLESFQNKFGELDKDTWRALQELERQNLISLTKNKATLTNRGILFYDTVASEII